MSVWRGSNNNRECPECHKEVDFPAAFAEPEWDLRAEFQVPAGSRHEETWRRTWNWQWGSMRVVYRICRVSRQKGWAVIEWLGQPVEPKRAEIGRGLSVFELKNRSNNSPNPSSVNAPWDSFKWFGKCIQWFSFVLYKISIEYTNPPL